MHGICANENLYRAEQAGAFAPDGLADRRAWGAIGMKKSPHAPHRISSFGSAIRAPRRVMGRHTDPVPASLWICYRNFRLINAPGLNSHFAFPPSGFIPLPVPQENENEINHLQPLMNRTAIQPIISQTPSWNSNSMTHCED